MFLLIHTKAEKVFVDCKFLLFGMLCRFMFLHLKFHIYSKNGHNSQGTTQMDQIRELNLYLNNLALTQIIFCIAFILLIIKIISYTSKALFKMRPLQVRTFYDVHLAYHVHKSGRKTPIILILESLWKAIFQNIISLALVWAQSCHLFLCIYIMRLTHDVTDCLICLSVCRYQGRLHQYRILPSDNDMIYIQVSYWY